MRLIEQNSGPLLQQVRIEIVRTEKLSPSFQLLPFCLDLGQHSLGLFDFALKVIEGDKAAVALHRMESKIRDDGRAEDGPDDLTKGFIQGLRKAADCNHASMESKPNRPVK